MMDNKTAKTFRPAWYWTVFPILSVVFSVLFLWQSQRVRFPTQEAKWVFISCAILAFFFGVASWICLKTYRIFLDGVFLRLKYIGIDEQRHDLSRVIEIRKRGFYITLNYGTVPRVALLAITKDNVELFNEISRAAFARESNRHN